jgi:hypothetical protein
MVDVEGTILREIADPWIKRADIAMTYAFGLRSSEEIDWPKINHAIIDRWSLSALKWIKDRAWKMHEGRS